LGYGEERIFSEKARQAARLQGLNALKAQKVQFQSVSISLWDVTFCTMERSPAAGDHQNAV
jgi:hypothetical protein